MTNNITLDEFESVAKSWLDANAREKPASSEKESEWGEGEFSVAVFHNLTFEEESALLQEAAEWQIAKSEEGYHAITWPAQYGGLDLPIEYARAFARLESDYITPSRHETFSVTTRLIAPTVLHYGTDDQKNELLSDLFSAKIYCCQLFSEPGTGSDLAGLGCKAVKDGDEWVINGQKVWSSGAQFSQWGELIARTHFDQPKHKGMTAFMIPMDLPGIEVRQIRQMSGGTSFNEVFFSDVRVPDRLRLGPEGEGWGVALTTLSFERDHSDSDGGGRAGGKWSQLLGTAKSLGLLQDPQIRQRLMEVYTQTQIQRFVNRRAADLRKSGKPPGPEGSLGKLLWTEGMGLMSDVVSEILGPRLVADTETWGTYEWGEHVLGAPGYRIAGGSDEIQRNIIGERVLGLPKEPDPYKGLPWEDIPKN